MAPKFGTSGLRGLVTELTPELVGAHLRAFLATAEIGPALYLGRDLRESSPHLAEVVAATARAEGVEVVDCGALPTPALALAAMGAGCAAVMVTGSHIPADRNGLKFYVPQGEITKAHEAAILAALDRAPGQGTGGEGTAALRSDAEAGARYAARYVTAFGPVLTGARIGLWAHSSVARDLMADVLGQMGAEVVEFGRSDQFIPVDTEAVYAPTRAQLMDWAGGTRLDAIVSTDGDADRPLLADATGTVVPGDIMGQISAAFLGAEVVVTPVSSNSGADDLFDTRRTRIGSPYVIAAMEAERGKVVGYEANGGFLLGFDAAGPAGALPRLMTRDCLLPILATLAASRTAGGFDVARFDVAARVAREPARFTATDRVEHVPTEASGPFLQGLLADELARGALLESLGLPTAHVTETTDGLRMTLRDGRVLHLRPSGNAPEFRIYAETGDPASARALLTEAMGLIAARLRG